MTDILDPMSYLPAPKLSLARGVSLVDSLLAMAPKDSTEAVQRYASQLRAKADLISAYSTERAKAENERPESRSADQWMDNAIRSLHERLTAAAGLPAERYPEAADASSLVESLFPDGLSFLLLRIDEEWFRVKQLMKRIDDEGLASKIDAIAGPAYLTELRLAYANYGKALGKTEARPGSPSQVNMRDEIKDLSRLISAYTLQVLATADETRPETIKSIRRALQPLVDYRTVSSRGHSPEPEPEEEEKTPVNPPSTTTPTTT